jgi:hypothetical protein
MTLDTTSLITLTDSALEGGNALSAIAGQIASMPITGTGAGCAMSSTSSSSGRRRTSRKRWSSDRTRCAPRAICSAGRTCVTLPARENAQKLVGLLGCSARRDAARPGAVRADHAGHALEAEPGCCTPSGTSRRRCGAACS